eukprot:TRINITY_DN27853_c2_g1_i1.p1 TRINITY_DN27853_c2_g1~~TRINITY_DN27853_c2_g1_i1.p1  ORF type:complete len:211 (+),score=29.29 TRINITY_DN27853_c2_g1_i1:66-698(+)
MIFKIYIRSSAALLVSVALQGVAGIPCCPSKFKNHNMGDMGCTEEEKVSECAPGERCVWNGEVKHPFCEPFRAVLVKEPAVRVESDMPSKGSGVKPMPAKGSGLPSTGSGKYAGWTPLPMMQSHHGVSPRKKSTRPPMRSRKKASGGKPSAILTIANHGGDDYHGLDDYHLPHTNVHYGGEYDEYGDDHEDEDDYPEEEEYDEYGEVRLV